MSDWTVQLVMIVCVFVGIRIGRRQERRKYVKPYSWRCAEEGCDLEIEGVYEVGVHKAAKIHALSHHKGASDVQLAE